MLLPADSTFAAFLANAFDQQVRSDDPCVAGLTPAKRAEVTDRAEQPGQIVGEVLQTMLLNSSTACSRWQSHPQSQIP